MSDRIDHVAGANAYKLIDDVDSILDGAGRSSFGEREGALALIEATRAQALATLALVEQQRIANLIAFSIGPNDVETRHKAERMIRGGLGL